MVSPRRRPTQLDVARAAGVSQAVVSYVLNDNQTISIAPETRQRVLDAIATLGYIPNTAARSLRSRTTHTIAAIIPDITNPYYPEFVRGIQDVATAQGYDVLSFNTDGEYEMERQSLDVVRRGRADGVILTAFHLTMDELRPLLEEGTPIALLSDLMDEYLDQPIPLDALAAGGDFAAESLVTYLIERGHTRIGMIAGIESTPPRETRVLGYRHALANHGLTADEIMIRGGDFTEAGGYESMSELLSMSPRPTAVFAANDLMAMGALLACREAGVRVPEDVALAGFDDIPAAKLVH
ncbi:MAG TPA: LacI family DNA-binding transcriptional regulator, partial [Thermomicrobiales bacterium]|nr:LacI family DNA-binding transcriptional regulator [Thermomicrobiales bacterium]